MEATGASPVTLTQTQPETASKSRLHWLDIAKGIAIFLVVLGHTEDGLINGGILPATPFLRFLNDWVYAFHVPVFFFVSGMLATRLVQKRTFVSFITDKLKVIVYPYVLWTIIQIVLMTVMAGQTNNPVGPVTLTSLVETFLITPFMEFWYLYALFLIYLLLVVVIWLTSSKAVFLGVSVVFFLAGLAFRDQMSSIIAATSFSSLIFALGMYFSDWLRNRLPAFGTSTLLLITALGFTVMTVGVGVATGIAFQPFFLAVLGIAATLCLAIVIDRYGIPVLTDVLRLWGMKSLQIYVAHTIAAAGVRIILSRFLGFNNALVHFIIGMTAGMYGPIFLDWICHRIGFKYAFTLRE